MFGRGASETIGWKKRRTSTPASRPLLIVNFPGEIQPPTAVNHRKEGTIAGNPALQGYYLAFPALLFYVKLRTQKGNFFKPTWKEIPQKNGWTSNRATPIGLSNMNFFGDHHIFASSEPTSN